MAPYSRNGGWRTPSFSHDLPTNDTPTTWAFNNEKWSPENYENEYDGLITFRQALARSRNIATIKVAESAGYQVAGEIS